MNLTAIPSTFMALCVIAWLMAPAHAQLVADAHEQPPRVELEQVFSETLMQSGEHRVEDNLRIVGTRFEFSIDSAYGRYQVRSIPMAILRIHEIRTLAQAVDAYQRENQRLAEELRGIIQVGTSSSAAMLASPLDPGSAATGQLVNNNVGQAIDDARRSKGTQDIGLAKAPGADENLYESWIPGDPILAAHKSAVAAHLDLDIYSSNTRVQAFLDTLARARAGGNRGAGMATVSLPNRPEISVDRGRIEFAVRTAVARMSVRELYVQNQAALAGIGIEPDVYHAFLSHRAFSPRHKSEITAYLVYLQGVANRGELLRAALQADNETEALGYVRMARMLAYYHESTERLKGLVSGGSVLMATTGSGNMALALPFDFLWWSAETDRVFSSLANFADDNRFKLRELLLIGISSDAARAQLERRKFTVREKFLFRP
ncbi:MAG: hypothetical protein GTO67_09740 [Gammaproteobacteria bacterium]|nr:hypothetical protein [Gammaproteobacteria bacterium]NIM74033.1 hypothetical protein [Gammaproteobacteria bacterium]NIN38915.1 hypothetical protein [Gammaproteobacteria bacterium]NIO25808.1 hypothetical protein [Gammaproteobacteria bacterium]NIO66439.1 hypothetical protein [Gammaproteobacteria bacterium]